jgi:hypothetical protein
VEVKGVKAHTPAFIMTAGEYEYAKAQEESKFVLCVVINALSKKRKLLCYTKEEFLNRFILKPLHYRATLRKQHLGLSKIGSKSLVI